MEKKDLREGQIINLLLLNSFFRKKVSKMKNNKKMRIFTYVTKLLALIFMIIALPFYFGFGNPLPFINPNYSFIDNLWLTILPVMFIALIISFKYEKLGGYLLFISVFTGILLTLLITKEFFYIMMLPLLIGVLFLLISYNK